MKDIPTNAVKAVIRNDEDEILMLRRHPLRDGPTNWDLPGGLVEEGEEQKDALRREVKEELGVEIIVGREVGRWSFHRALDDKTVNVTNFEASTDTSDFALGNEHDASKFFPEVALSTLALKDSSILDALG